MADFNRRELGAGPSQQNIDRDKWTIILLERLSCLRAERAKGAEIVRNFGAESRP